MLDKLKKIKLYYKALYKGELIKKIEYKIKDLLGYFYIRNKLQNKRQISKIIDLKLDIPDISEEFTGEKYRIFNKEYSYEEFIKNLKVEKLFWRKIKLNQYEDVKIIWEFNRLQILLPLTIKYLKTQNIKYKENIDYILEYWEQNNPFEYTLNWNSNLEVAIRAINIALCLILLQDAELNYKYSKLLYLHAKHIYSEINYSDCCIPNNHVIGEATALLLLSKVLKVKENVKWYRKSIKILKEYINIIDDDGASKENSFSYQFFVTKMYILALCFIEEDFFDKLNEKIIKSLNVLKYTIVNKEEILNYGDNDDGFLYSFDMNYNIAKDIKGYYNLFFKNENNIETEIYNEILKIFNKKNKIKNGIENKNSYLITKNLFIYNDNNIVLFFNAKNIEGHAHNDSLAINLIVNGEQILLDSGTYSYNKCKKERRHFRGREAHTTIQFKDKNAIDIGSFRWINKSKSYISNFSLKDEEIIIEGTIENIATRKIFFDKDGIKINDEYFKNDKIETNWITSNNAYLYGNIIKIDNCKIEFKDKVDIKLQEVLISKNYLEKNNAILYNVKSINNSLETKILFKEK